MWNFEACGKAQADGLLRIPIDENPFEERSGSQITLVGKIVEALGASARQVEMMKHLINLHSSPLTRRVGRHTLDTPSILLPLLLREKEIAINLFHPECSRDVADDRESGDPEVASKSGA
jgi:hypothetical protein